MKQNKALSGIFKSTTLRLTGWYLLILMLISIMFSTVIFQVASNEIHNRMNHFQTSVLQQQRGPNATPPIELQLASDTDNTAEANLSIQLLYINLIVLIVGGFGSYFFARRSLEPIRKAHNAQSRFTSDASHELRTPLAVMKTELEVALRDKNATSSELKEVLASNLEEVNKLSKLAEMLLSLSQLETLELKMKSIHLDSVVRDTIKQMNGFSKRISLSSKNRPVIKGNEAAVNDLIKILLDNALQYSPVNSKISISIFKQDNHAVFEITNSGAGIQADKLPYIFDRFFRADSSRSDKQQKSYGLGLALAKNIVDLHNGEIIASSIPDGETTFKVILPLNSSDQANTQN